MSPFGPDSLFEHFQSFEMPKQIPGKQGLGSGLVVKSDGHILTNHHVVKGAEKIEVTLSDNQTFQATVIGTDPETDLAVLKIDASGLQPVKWADSEQAEVGEWVVAIGSPFGWHPVICDKASECESIARVQAGLCSCVRTDRKALSLRKLFCLDSHFV